MPIINGRYYLNPVMGHALEAAREADAPREALENHARQNPGSDEHTADGFDDPAVPSATQRAESSGPIHRIEIEAAELVPAHSGRAARGFVARVHRQPAAEPRSGRRATMSPTRAVSPTGRTETHVFADHRDLVSYLRDELSREAHGHHS